MNGTPTPPPASPTTGEEIRRLRQAAGLTLRALARRVHVSAAHLSDIEHDRRRPSGPLLARIADELRGVGGSVEGLERKLSGLDDATRAWIATTPGARALVRRVMELGRDADAILAEIEVALDRRNPAEGETFD